MSKFRWAEIPKPLTMDHISYFSSDGTQKCLLVETVTDVIL